MFLVISELLESSFYRVEKQNSRLNRSWKNWTELQAVDRFRHIRSTGSRAESQVKGFLTWDFWTIFADLYLDFLARFSLSY